MFTGLIEEMGTISDLVPLDATESGGGGTSMTISDCPTILSDAQLGDSISCNGTCLTITELVGAGTGKATAFKVGIAPETLRRTNLGRLGPGSRLNLERAARAETRMGGHYVQGHVDGVAEIAQRREDGNSVVFRFRFVEAGGEPAADSARTLAKYVVEKGYVAVDGTSLTVTAAGPDWWEVMMIPYTRARIVTGAKQVGEQVNVEVDMVGKYVERSVRAYFEHGAEGLPGLENVVRRVLAER